MAIVDITTPKRGPDSFAESTSFSDDSFALGVSRARPTGSGGVPPATIPNQSDSGYSTRPVPTTSHPSDVLSDLKIQGMQKWEGRVIFVEGDYFTTELSPLGDDEPPSEDEPSVFADFDCTLIGKDAIDVGDVVYVTVRTVVDRMGRPQRTAAVRRRRLGAWTADELEKLRARARQKFKDVNQYSG